MKRYLLFAITGLTLLACSSRKEPHSSPVDEIPPTEPTFSSKKYDVSFPSELLEETLVKAGTFADNQIHSVSLMTLLPDCQVVEGEERCYETTVLSSFTGDSLQMEHRSYLDSIMIDSDRFGMTRTLEQSDIKKLLPALFAGYEKEAVSFCYSPRHAIAIFGPNQKMTGFIEICFECSESIAVLNSVEIPELSLKALNEIGALFLAYGFEEKPVQGG